MQLTMASDLHLFDTIFAPSLHHLYTIFRIIMQLSVTMASPASPYTRLTESYTSFAPLCTSFASRAYPSTLHISLKLVYTCCTPAAHLPRPESPLQHARARARIVAPPRPRARLG
jgi:hypothetical protein